MDGIFMPSPKGAISLNDELASSPIHVGLRFQGRCLGRGQASIRLRYPNGGRLVSMKLSRVLGAMKCP